MMYILSGMSFAGKSVFAGKISKRKGIEIVDPDKISSERGLGLHGEFIPEKIWIEINKEAQRRAKKLLEQSKSLVYDSVALNKQERDKLRILAENNRAEPIVIIINITKESAYKRWRNNDKMQRHLIHIDDFNACADGFEFPKENEKCLIYEAEEDFDKWFRKNLKS